MTSILQDAWHAAQRKILHLLHQRRGKLTRELVLSPGTHGLGRFLTACSRRR